MELMNELTINQVGETIWKMNRIELPNTPAVYFIWNDKKELLYVGQTKTLLKRTVQHFHQEIWFRLFAKYISFVDTPEEELRAKEYLLIQEFRPKYNFAHYTGVTDEQMGELARSKPIL